MKGKLMVRVTLLAVLDYTPGRERQGAAYAARRAPTCSSAGGLVSPGERGRCVDIRSTLLAAVGRSGEL
jgi:hypothetical protein